MNQPIIFVVHHNTYTKGSVGWPAHLLPIFLKIFPLNITKSLI